MARKTKILAWIFFCLTISPAPRPKSNNPRRNVINFRLTDDEFDSMERLSNERGFPSLSDYLRHLHAVQSKIEREAHVREQELLYGVLEPKLFEETSHGKIFLGDSLGLLHKTLAPHSVDLIMTSPPFGLVRKKDYGNEDADQFVEWFRPFAAGMKRVVKEQGSIVIDIGGAWEPGTPTRHKH